MKASTALLIVAMAAAGFALTMVVFYPGYLTNDATYVYRFMQEWRFGDWQSPLMSMLWWVVDPIAPGPGSMFLVFATLYWLGFAIVALTVARRSALLGLIVPLLALVPPAFMLLAMIWRDVLFGVVWLVAAAIVYASAGRGAPWRAAVAAIALALIGFGILLRPTAIFAAPLLAAYMIWPRRFDFKRAAIVFLPAVALGYALIHVVYYVALDVKRENPLHSVFVFDVGGITHFSGENQFPVSWTAEQDALLKSRCYNPDRWDSYWTMEPCRFVMQRLEQPDDQIFGTPRLTQAWVRAVTGHPLAYLQHRLTFFWTFLASPDALTLELYNASDPAKTPLAENRYFKSIIALYDVLKPTVLFRPGLWLVLAAVIGVMAVPRRATPSGAFAIGVTSSAIAYVMTFLPFGVAADFRYGYWCVLASLVAAAAALAAYREPSAPPDARFWFSRRRTNTARDSATTLSTIAVPSSADAAAASPMTPSWARRGSSVRHGQVVPRSKITAWIVSVSTALPGAMRSRRTRSGASASITEVSLLPPWTSNGSPSTLARSKGWMAQALSAKSPWNSRSRFSRIPRLPPCPLTIARLRAGSDRAMSRVRSCSNLTKVSIDSESVPGAQSCSRESPIGIAGSCHRSNASPQRAIMARVSPSAITTSVSSGRCGPCCSIAPSGRQRMEVSRSCRAMSGDVSSAMDRLVAMRLTSACHHAHQDAIPAHEMLPHHALGLPADRCFRRLSGLGNRRQQMIELVARARRLGGEIAPVVRVDRTMQGNSSRHFDPGLHKPIELCRIVGQQPHALAAENLQHAGRDSVVALVVIKAQGCVGVDRIEPSILELVGAHLVGEPEAATLLLEIENNAATQIIEPAERQSQLIAAIATPRAEHVPGQAGRMQAQRDRFAEIRRSHNDRNRAAADGVAENHKPRRQPAIEWHVSLGRNHERVDGGLPELDYGVGRYGHQRRVARRRSHHRTVGDQQCGQPLCKFGELNGGACECTCCYHVELALDAGIGGQRKDLRRAVALGNRKTDRAVGGKAKRLGAAIREHQMRNRRPAQLPIGGEPLVRHSVDRQGQRCFTVSGDHHRSSGAELAKSALDRHMIGCTEQAHDTSILTVAHGPSRRPSLNPYKQCSGTCCSLNRLGCNTGNLTIYLFKYHGTMNTASKSTVMGLARLKECGRGPPIVKDTSHHA
jgi:hypothetical protein